MQTGTGAFPAQLSFADLTAPENSESDGATGPAFDIPLFATTFVVVDLETTGTRAGSDRITEIGAVKVRGGEVLGELATLVDPGRAIPPQIVALTGITQAMVYSAPTIGEVLPSFLEFARGSILVAHNARFDMAFLRAAAADSGVPWTFPPALCTVTLARRVLPRDEAPRVKLAALAQLFDVQTTPTHRALDDARATVEVMHNLFERIGNLGVDTYRELRDYLPGVPREVRAKNVMARHLPHRPGVYLFRGPSDEVLYVGTATDLRRRVAGYFTGSETRTRMREMVALATRVDHVECAHRLEAGVRELRLLAAHAPAYNRRSKYPRRGWWVCLTDEAFPRLKVTRTASTGDAVGPVTSRATAQQIADVIAEACGLRSCTTRLPRSGSHGCELTADGRRPAGGCHAAGASAEPPEQYAPRAARVRALLRGESDDALHTATARLASLARAEMFETAARIRDRLADTVTALDRCQRLTALCAIEEVVIARPDGERGWEIAIVRHGRLAAAGVAHRGVAPMPVITALTATAETVVVADGPLRGAPPEEAGLIYRWMTEPGCRIVRTTSGLGLPAHSACRWTAWSRRVHDARETGRRLAAMPVEAG
ncbi:DEDD exonuclease domain-containing protein [Williamsia sterculiae]|uniref:DNA polymerase-3 subunit epsilon n=1 Tax=Williamsia sterculiae TaxID=1344003 RepID=A0A1N7H7Q6_9NOCA|nr:DEDD exonuclease domain-containing protein [Williamsia sterculiae]SIS20803.1 DNA polymerase-3 subunit epsilon [Williamsia sterculiae]